MKKYQRLQSKEWHKVKNSFRLLYTYKSDKGNIKGIYTDGKIKIVHWLNDEEKTDYLQGVKGNEILKILDGKDELGDKENGFRNVCEENTSIRNFV